MVEAVPNRNDQGRPHRRRGEAPRITQVRRGSSSKPPCGASSPRPERARGGDPRLRSFRFRNRAPARAGTRRRGKGGRPPKKIPYFKMGKELKALLNSVGELRRGARPPLPRARRRPPGRPSPPWVSHTGEAPGPAYPAVRGRLPRRAGDSRVRAFLTDLSEKGGARPHRRPSHPRPAPRSSWRCAFGRQAPRPAPRRVRWSKPSPRGGSSSGRASRKVAATSRRPCEAVVEEFRAGRVDRPERRPHERRRRRRCEVTPPSPAPGPRRRLGSPSRTTTSSSGSSRCLRHGHDDELLAVVRSARHFFVRQEAAKRIRDDASG